MLPNFNDFEQELYEASYNTIEAIKRDCQKERLYSFTFGTSGLFGYIFPNANTEEGIVAGTEYDMPHAFTGRLDLALKCTRWEPSALWRFFHKYNDYFSTINQLLEDIDIQDAFHNLSEIEFDKAIARVEDSLFNVLNRLRNDGCFGPDSDEFYLNIIIEDQTFEQLHKSALRVNTPEVCRKMFADLSEVQQFWDDRCQKQTDNGLS